METFPVSYSSLDTKSLLQFVVDKYEVDSNSTITFLKRGFNDTYLITEQLCKKYIFRVYNNNRRDKRSINSELIMLAMMKHNTDIGVSEPIGSKDGSLTLAIKAPEGERTAVLFSFAEGQPVRKLSKEQSFLLGKETAKFHNYSLNYQRATIGENYDIATQFTSTLTTLRSILKNYPVQFNYILKLKTDFIETFVNANINELAHGICHGDLQAENIHYTDDNKITIFDFDFIGKGFLAYDIGVFIWYDR